MKYSSICAFLAMAFMMSCSCDSKNSPQTPDPTPEPTPTPQPAVEGAYSYTTTADKSSLFAEKTISFGKTASMSPYAVRFTDDTYQTIDGFGAALTVASCYNILKMPQDKREAFLKQMFDTKTGIGSSLIRVCIGGSDFSIERFTWCDTKGIENFAPAEYDLKYVIPVLKEIKKINPALKIIGSPWTAPRWMKKAVNSDVDWYSWTGGTLKPSCYQDYAEYFVKWIQYMKSQGLDIYAVTPQNEPLNAGNSMSMVMHWDVARDFIKTALGPAFKKAGLDTKILVFDHNYNYDNMSDQAQYPLKIYADAQASAYIAGSAWHNYGGNVSELDKIVAGAPDKELYFTEASIGTWNYNFSSCLINDMRDIFFGLLKRGGKGVTLWNLMLDENKGPYTDADGSCKTCYGAVTIASSDYSSLDYYTHYYNIAHCSKVIEQGAVRIGTKGYTADGLEYLVFKNQDNSYGVIILNENSDARQLVFISAEHSVKCDVPAKSIVSLKWKD